MQIALHVQHKTESGNVQVDTKIPLTQCLQINVALYYYTVKAGQTSSYYILVLFLFYYIIIIQIIIIHVFYIAIFLVLKVLIYKKNI